MSPRTEPLGSLEGLTMMQPKEPTPLEFHEALRIRRPKWNYCPLCGQQLWSTTHQHSHSGKEMVN
ncbi:MAG: hypothetical protein M1503_11550 [Thaumarchaeota archaeon]|nr:hypothetical protein [Nitrososphaerota archaeon]MCL5318878.1 hypothetical protein [Nitrososphaerota archaeon]